MVIGAVIAAMGFSGGCAGTLPPNAGLVRERQAILCLVNAERTAHGLRPLREDRRLDRAAQGHTVEMVRRNYVSHTGARGSSPLQRIRGAGYLRRASTYAYGENIAFGNRALNSPAQIVARWMNSPGHRAQILSSGFRDSGIGFVARLPGATASRRHRRGVTVTQDFAARG